MGGGEEDIADLVEPVEFLLIGADESPSCDERAEGVGGEDAGFVVGCRGADGVEGFAVGHGAVEEIEEEAGGGEGVGADTVVAEEDEVCFGEIGIIEGDGVETRPGVDCVAVEAVYEEDAVLGRLAAGDHLRASIGELRYQAMVGRGIEIEDRHVGSFSHPGVALP